MKSLPPTLLLTGLVGTATFFLCAPPVESCCALPREYRDRVGGPRPVSTIRLDKQSAFLWREGSTEHMLLSVIYSGGTDEFAWVIPVESRPKVTVDKGAPFTELRRATQIIIPRAPMLEASTRSAPAGAAKSVTVLERKEEGPYDIAVLQATSSGGLYEWLKENDFHLSKNAKGYINHYVERKFVFVAARIRTGAKGNQAIANRLKNGTIAPMHLSFKAKELSYPLRVTAANPGASEMELYVAGAVRAPKDVLAATQPSGNDPFSPRVGGLKVESFKLEPQGKTRFTLSGPPGLANSQGDFPTLRRLLPKGGELTKYTGVLHDSQRQNDLVFAQL